METLPGGKPSAALREVTGALTGYLDGIATDLPGSLTDPDLLAELHEFEVLRRRLAVVDHAIIAELDRRGLAARLVMSSP